jgi:hypothetical protein
MHADPPSPGRQVQSGRLVDWYDRPIAADIEAIDTIRQYHFKIRFLLKIFLIATIIAN